MEIRPDHLPPVIETAPWMLIDGGALDVDRCPDCWERRAHIERYTWACKVCAGGMRVLDFGCGTGYGSEMLARAGNYVYPVDSSEAAHSYLAWRSESIAQHARRTITGHYDACVAFEVLEHLADPGEFIRTVPARHLIVSVPIRAEDDNPHHRTRFTSASIQALIETRFRIVSRWQQTEPFHWDPSIAVFHGEERA